jgi:SAM-dependent methyltransferase
VSNDSATRFAAEEQRIKQVYAARRSDIPSHRYSDLNPGNLLITQELERRVLRLLAANGVPSLAQTRVLEVGCWQGFWSRKLVQWGAQPENVAGIDLLSEEIQEARRLSPPGITFACGNAVDLQYPDACFDIVCQFTVFTSVLDHELRERMAQEMLRVLRPSGFILWYDFFLNNPRNPSVRGIGKTEVRRLFPNCRFRLERTTLIPPLARTVAPLSSWLYAALSALKVLNSHYVGVVHKNLE